MQKAWDKYNEADRESRNLKARALETSKASRMDNANLAASAQKYVAVSGSGSATLGFLGTVNVKDRAKFNAEVSRVMKNAMLESAAIAEKGQAAIDDEIEKAFGTKRAYRY